ncbi:MAG: CDP-archaeol synthase [Saprospiraceae bacterium]|nr:CDP-archaeol synthase [Saprospiraceae bacterium]
MLLRSVTGILFGVVMLAGFLINLWTALALISIILIGCMSEFSMHFSNKSAIQKFPGNTFGLASLMILLLFFIMSIIKFTFVYEYLIFGFILSLIFIIIASINLKKPLIKFPYFNIWTAFVYIGLPLIILVGLLVLDYQKFHVWALVIILMIWANDTFAYFTGRLFGKTKLAPNISPGKTIEGSIGGFIFCLVTILVLDYYWIHSEYSIFKLLIFGILISVSSILGDLFESYLKRQIGIKDSGHILPGHGGMLDRFDSFLFAIPVGLFWIWINEKYL